MQEITVVLAVEDPPLQEEILHFLDRIPRVRILGAAGTAEELARRIRERGPQVAVVTPGVLGAVGDLDGAAVLVVGTEERTGDLRVALRAGARGFYLWPEERDALARDAIRAAPSGKAEERPPGKVVAVYGPRGGAGATFLATNLAAACAREGAETVLVDLDLFFADATVALGLAAEDSPRTLADLAPVLDELGAEHVEPVLHGHPGGFRVLLAPGSLEQVGTLTAAQATGLVRTIRSRSGLVILHLPRTIDDGVRGALEACDEILLVVSLDVLAFRDARRALDLLRALGLDGRCRLVINRAVRSEVVPQDAERVFGLRPTAVIRHDRTVPRAQNRGDLVAGRSGPAGRGVRTLARHLLGEDGS